MSRDRKPARAARAPARSAGGTLIGIFIGLVFGALIAAGAAWYFTRANPFQPAPVAPRVQAPDNGPAALPGKPGDRPVVKQDFEFYRILPQGENVPAQAQAPTPTTRRPSRRRSRMQSRDRSSVCTCRSEHSRIRARPTT